MGEENNLNYLQQIFHIFLTKKLASWADAKKWASENKINENTMQGAWYKPHGIGLGTMDSITSKLLSLTPEKVATLEDKINKLAPIPESTIVWNSLKIPENEKLRLAYIARAIWEIESKIKEKK